MHFKMKNVNNDIFNMSTDKQIYTDKQSKMLKCLLTINSLNWTVIKVNANGKRFVYLCLYSAVCMISR